MPRYLVERSFPDGLSIPVDEGGARTCQAVVDGKAPDGVTWIQSYVTTDKQMTFCVYDGPSPEAIRRAAEVNQLPVDRITEVRGAAVESPDATGASAPRRHPGDIGRRRLASCQAAVRSHRALEATA